MKLAQLVAVLWVSTFPIHTHAEYAVGDIPQALKAGANGVVRQEVLVVDMLSPTKVRYQVKQAITVLNRGGENKARLALYYNKSVAIKRVNGRVFDGDGLQIAKFGLKDFADESAVSNFSLYEDDRVKHFLPSVTYYPYTVEYEYELELKQNLIIPAWQPDIYPDISVQHSQFTFIAAQDDEVRVKTLNHDGEPVTTTLDGRKSTTWLVADIPAQRREPYSPDPQTYKTIVRVAPVSFSYYKQEGRYTNWEELGKWNYDVLLAGGRTLPPETIRTVQQLADGLPSDREKAEALYGYLQKKTRYVSVQIGIGGFKPVAASEVDRLGYGDCKGLVNYMQALLDVVNIPSYYCVVEAGSGKRDIQADFAGMEQGNHIILCLPFQQDTIWLECTSQHTPFGFLGSFTDDRLVWACTPEGGKLLRTPQYGDAASTQLRRATLVLDSTGGVSGEVETEFAFGQYDNHLQIAESTGKEQLKLLKEAYNIDRLDVSGLDYRKEQSDGKPLLTERFSAMVTNYVPENGGKLFLVPNLFNRQHTVPTSKNRKLPVYINRGYTDEDRISYTLPDGYTLASGALDQVIECSFGYYRVLLQQKGNQLSYYRKFVLREGTFPAHTYTEFSGFINKVYVLDHHKAILAR